MTFPEAKLRIECATVNPPKPIGCGVFVGDKLIATLSLAELLNAAHKAEKLELKQKGYLK